jgi:hypothetical protein
MEVVTGVNVDKVQERMRQCLHNAGEATAR